MTIALSNADPSSGASSPAGDHPMMQGLQVLTLALTEYVVHRKALEERRSITRLSDAPVL